MKLKNSFKLKNRFTYGLPMGVWKALIAIAAMVVFQSYKTQVKSS